MKSDAKRLTLQRRSTTRQVYNTGYGRCLIRCRKTSSDTLAAFWKAWGPKLRLDDSEFQLISKDQLQNTLGTQILWQQKAGGRPISRAWFRVDLNPEGDVVGFSNRCLTNRARKQFGSKPATVPLKTSLAKAGESFDREIPKSMRPKRPRRVNLLNEPRLVYVRRGDIILECWRLTCEVARPRSKANVYINAHTGAVVLHETLVLHRHGSSLAFMPNPMVVLNDLNLAPTATIPAAAYQSVQLRDLDASGFLDGLYVSTAATPHRTSSSTADFSASKSGQTGFYEAMAYYHIDAAQRYIRELVRSDRFPGRVLVNARSTVYGQSAYDFQNRILHLYGAGPRDGEDAEVILHEFGHALHGTVAPGFGQSGYAVHISEGFADYFAAARCSADKGPAFQKGIASWHARGAGKRGTPPFLRRLDFVGPVTPTRLIEKWASCLWHLRTILGPRRADTTALLALHLYDPHLYTMETVYNAALAYRQVNLQNFSDGNREIEGAFRRHQIFA